MTRTVPGNPRPCAPIGSGLHRRLLLGCGAFAGACALGGIDRPLFAAVPVPPAGTTRFRMLWKGKEIGHHTLEIARPGPGTCRIATTVDVTVKSGPLTLYRFRHHCEEQWRNRRLASLRSTTDDDGRQTSLLGHRNDAGIAVLTADGPQQVPGDILTSTSQWSRHFHRQRHVLDTRKGQLVSIVGKPAGTPMIALRGRQTVVDAFDVQGPTLGGTLFYLQEQWVGGGIRFASQTVTYELA